MRIRPRRIYLFIAVIFLVCGVPGMSGCSSGNETDVQAEHAEFVENVDALDVYYRFLYSIKSADITKTTVDSGSIYGLLSRTQEHIVYSAYGEKTKFLYRLRNPVVFFASPEYNYYDGKDYFYNYDGSWFVDRFNYYADQLTPDFLGIPASFFSDYTITFNELYRYSNGYLLKLQGVHNTDETLCEITGYADWDFLINEIVMVEQYGESRSGQPKQTVTTILYSRLNEPISIQRPDSLRLSDIEYLV